MRSLIPLISLSLIQSTAQVPVLEERWLYVSTPLKWERGHRPGQPAPKLASAEILVFEPTGSFASISCTLYTRPDRHLAIIFPEGYALTSGTWIQDQRHISARYRSIYSNVLVSDPSRAQQRVELFQYRPPKEPGRLASLLRSSDTTFVPLGKLADLEALAKVIAFHRAQANRE